MNDARSDTCCPEFNPEPWDKKIHVWKDKPFLVRTVPQFLHMPIPGFYGKAITAMYEEAEYEGIAPGAGECLLLTHDPSPWKSILYLAVTEAKPGVPVETLSGTFASMVFDAPYNKVPSFIEIMDMWLAESGKQAKKYYFYFTTCPKCAKKYGHNYIVAFAQI